MKIGPKYKIAKRLGASVFEKTQTQKFALSEARKSKIRRGGRRKNVSDFGKQLLEKQKVRFTYGITEKQFRNYVDAVLEMHGVNPGEELHKALERRLDNTVARATLATTRRGARQMVSHGHFLVNGKRVNVPSYQVRPGDVITVKASSKNMSVFEDIKNKLKNYDTPPWLSLNEDTLEGKVESQPKDVHFPFNINLVVDYYSKQ